MDGLIDAAGAVGNWFLEQARRFFGEPAYQEGFLAAVVMGLSFYLFGSAFVYLWNRVIKFFSSTKGPPSPTAGPAPADSVGGCLIGVLGLLALSAIVIFVFAGAIFR